MHPQLVLALDTAPTSSFDSFYTGAGNQLAVTALETFANDQFAEQQLYIWGETGAGKSHLLSAVCQRVSGKGYRIAYVPADMANQLQSLQGLEQCDLVCIDDLHRITQAAEIELFHCINRCRENNTRLLFAADRPVDQIGFNLPDLRTRLSWGAGYQIIVLGDDDLRSAVQRQLESRAMSVQNDVVDFLLRRYPRNMRFLKTLLEQLDAASLSAQRRITIPLIREVVSENEQKKHSRQTTAG